MKRPKALNNYIVTIVGSITTLLLSLISDFILSLPIEITWLTFSIGAILTISITLLERSISEYFHEEVIDKLDLYNTLSKIDDPELYKLAQEALLECRNKLDEYRQGVIASSEHSRWYGINQLQNSKRSLHATYWAMDRKKLHSLMDTALGLNYLEENLSALKRGVSIKRVFVLRKSAFLEADGNTLDKKSFDILNKLHKSGVDLRISWVEEWSEVDDEIVTENHYQDFGIFDNEKLFYNRYGANNVITGLIVLKSPKKINEYEKLFQKIWSLGRKFDDVMS